MQLEPDVEDNWRLLENALAMVRKLAEKQVPSFVPLVLQRMTGLDDDEEWCVSYEIEDGPAGQRRGAGQREPAELRKPHSRTRGAFLLQLSAPGQVDSSCRSRWYGSGVDRRRFRRQVRHYTVKGLANSHRQYAVRLALD